MTGRRRTWRRCWRGATASFWISSGAIASLLAGAAGAQDPREIVKRSLELDNRNDRIARQYTFLERIDERRLDGQGRLTRREVRTYDVTLLEGSPYRRLVERDDKPLPPAEERKEQEKLQKSIAMRLKETPGQRARRFQAWEQERQRSRQQLLEIPEAFDFTLAGEEVVDGHRVWAIGATPRRGYRPRSRFAKFLPKMRGRLWIDRNEYQWVKAEAEVLDTISLGWFLVRVARGTRMSFENTRVNDEVWLPRRVDVSGSARLLVRSLRADVEITFRKYRKFQADSRLVSSEPKP